MNEALWQYLLESGAGLLLLYLFYALVLKRETCFQFNRFYLITALFLSFMVPLSQLPGISLWPPEPVEAEAVFEITEAMVTYEAVAAPVEESFNYWNLLYVAYGMGAVFFAGRFLGQLMQLRRFARQERVSFFLPNRAPVILTNGQFPTFSFWRYVFFDNSQSLTPEETERILQHEQVHIDQRHTLDVLLVSLAGIIFWFNPLLVLYKKALEQTHEFIADAQVAKVSGSNAYSSLLVKQVFKNADFPLGSYFFLHTSLTLTRIKMMKKLHQSPKLSRMLLVVPAWALFLTAVAAMRPVQAPEEKVSDVSTAKPENGPAQFPGGREALNTYVKNNFILPQVAFQKRKNPNDFVSVRANIEVEVQEDGTAVFRRTVDLDVQPNDAAVVTAVTQQFAALVRQMPKWTAAQKDGKAIASKEMISVSSVSGNFLTHNAYLEGRQQKTSVSSEAVAPQSTQTKPAEFPGGSNTMYHFFNSRFVVPQAVFEARGTSDSTIKFLRYIKAELSIATNGSVEQAKVIEIATRPFQTQQVSAAVEKEFLRLVRQMPRWTPAYENGKPVASTEKIVFAAITKIAGKETFEQAKKAQEKRAEVPLTPQKNTTPDGSPVFIAVEQMPEFPGGTAAMMKYLKENTVYPEDAKQAKVAGTMVASFVINSEGKVTDVQVLKKLHPSLDHAFAKSLESMPAWKPGTQNGKAVAVKYTIPYRVVGEAVANGTNEPNHNQEEKIYIAVQEMPVFPGGQAGMLQYLKQAVVYPANAKAAKAEGTATVSFVVNKEGNVTKAELLHGIHPSLDQSLLKAVQNMPTWKPGMQNGKTVRVKYTLPFKFVLPKEAK
ncbi:M56 family metallopeptidase [Rufibacter sp. XAAS-G3-1]|uniref:M56 family metallopeptidase n=1 Tax=Rufibacter sp. XAAS-G3-1 TaxID=2729134 RepID=UPI0015E6305C|nr:M56 family metallopeptidase [Rufibacter sp. XAAS-G3-1]